MLSDFIEQHQLPQEFGTTVKQYYLPIAERIFNEFDQKKAPLFVGINGCQGSGKSTFTAFVGEYLRKSFDLKVSVISLDDFYLTSIQRKEKAANIHPLLATRGVPGTHDVTLLKNTLENLAAQKTDFYIPQFNKALDEPRPESEWLKVDEPIDIILFEGWCWGVSSQTEEQLQTSVNELEREQDAKKLWRTYVNEQIVEHYQPLYNMMQYWIALQASSFDWVYQWRLEQEIKLTNKTENADNTAIMSSAEILNFIQYFQRLTEHGMETLPKIANTTLYLNCSRTITQRVEK